MLPAFFILIFLHSGEVKTLSDQYPTKQECQAALIIRAENKWYRGACVEGYVIRQ